MNTNDIAALGVGIVHHFAGGLYAKETHIPAGVSLTKHVHDFDHLSILVSGDVVVIVDGHSTHYGAPAFLTIKAGRAHEILAVTPSTWVCLHATDETDPEKVDAAVIEEATA